MAGDKDFPHVMYDQDMALARRKIQEELRHAQFCQYAFDLKCENIIMC